MVSSRKLSSEEVDALIEGLQTDDDSREEANVLEGSGVGEGDYFCYACATILISYARAVAQLEHGVIECFLDAMHTWTTRILQ